jgi:hypothetical protein
MSESRSKISCCGVYGWWSANIDHIFPPSRNQRSVTGLARLLWGTLHGRVIKDSQESWGELGILLFWQLLNRNAERFRKFQTNAWRALEAV